MAQGIPVKSLDGQVLGGSPAYGTSFDFREVVDEVVGCAVFVFGETATPVVGLQGSFDGSAWYALTLDTSLTVSGTNGQTKSVVAKSVTPTRYVRAYTATDGGATSASSVTVYVVAL